MDSGTERRPALHHDPSNQATPSVRRSGGHSPAPVLLPLALLLAVLALALAGCGSADGIAGDGLDGGRDGGTLVDSGFRQVVVDGSRLGRPWGKALGDLDGDGEPEALVGLHEGPIHWYRGPGWARRTLGDRFGGDDLAVADVDGDGAADAVTNGGSIAWYRNPRGTGGDIGGAWRLNLVQGGMAGHDLGVADVDGDGRTDIATRQENGPTTLFLNSGGSGDSLAWRRIDLGRASAGTGMALGDVDGDGRMDVVQNGYWLEQPPEVGDDWARRDFADWHATSAVAVADLNGDGRRDIVLSVGADDGEVAWFENTGSRGRWPRRDLGPAGWVHKIHAVDMDGDGDLDIVFSEQLEAKDARVGVFYNRGGGGAWDLGVVAGRGAHNIAVDDVGGDGDLDILGADWREDTRLFLWENLGR